MNNLTNEKIRAILDGAPDGVCSFEGWRKRAKFGYTESHNLSDLREILALRESLSKMMEQRDEFDNECTKLAMQNNKLSQRVAELESQQNPVKWFTYCCDDGYNEHDSYEAAKEYGDELVRSWLHDCWDEEVANVRMGVVTHEAKEGERTYRQGEIDEEGCDESGMWWASDWDYVVNWSLEPLPQPPKENINERD
jgi:hypothetical protein